MGIFFRFTILQWLDFDNSHNVVLCIQMCSRMPCMIKCSIVMVCFVCTYRMQWYWLPSSRNVRLDSGLYLNSQNALMKSSPLYRATSSVGACIQQLALNLHSIGAAWPQQTCGTECHVVYLHRAIVYLVGGFLMPNQEPAYTCSGNGINMSYLKCHNLTAIFC